MESTVKVQLLMRTTVLTKVCKYPDVHFKFTHLWPPVDFQVNLTHRGSGLRGNQNSGAQRQALEGLNTRLLGKDLHAGSISVDRGTQQQTAVHESDLDALVQMHTSTFVTKLMAAQPGAQRS